MKQILALFIFFSFCIGEILSQEISTTKTKTVAYQKYQQDNAFKGIRFGTKLRIVDAKLILQSEDLLVNTYSIGNYKFLQYGGMQFSSGEAYFTDEAELYQVVIHEDSLKDGIYAYDVLKKYFLKVFGKNDSERADIPTKIISWDGPIVNVLLMFSPDRKNPKDGSISITVFNMGLNNKSNDQLFKVKRPAYDLDDPLPEM